MKKGFLNQKAFTLVEAVVAITIIGVIGVIMSDILTRAFDNTQKTNLISGIQQSGQAGLTAYEDTIRYSEFVCVGGFDSQDTGAAERAVNESQVEYHSPVLVVFKEGRYIRFRMVPENQAGTSNGFIAEDFPAPPVVDSTASDLCLASNQVTTGRKVTNNTMLSLKRGTITLLSNPVADANPNIVGTKKVSLTIQFAMGPTGTALVNPESQIGQNNEILFQTTAQFR